MLPDLGGVENAARDSRPEETKRSGSSKPLRCRTSASDPRASEEAEPSRHLEIRGMRLQEARRAAQQAKVDVLSDGSTVILEIKRDVIY